MRAARLQLCAQYFRRDFGAAHLDLERADLVLGDQSLERLQVEGRDLPNLESGEKRAAHQVSSGQIVNPFREPVQVMLARKAVEQTGAEQRRVGVVDRATRRGDRRQPIGRVFAVGPRRRFQGAALPVAGRRRSSPNQTVASLHSPRRLISSISTFEPAK